MMACLMKLAYFRSADDYEGSASILGENGLSSEEHDRHATAHYPETTTGGKN